MPRRRGVLKKTVLTVTAISASGCLIADDAGDPGVAPEDRDRPCWQNIDGERIDQEPFFDPGREDEMVLSDDEMHSVYDSYDDEDYPEYNAFIDTVDNSVTVLFNAYVHHTVDGAKTRYNENKDSYDDPDTFTGFADQAIRHTGEDYAEMTIRVSNAVGHVISYVPDEAPEDPDDRRTTPRMKVFGFGQDLHDYWAGTSDYKNQPGFCRQEVMDLQQPDENN